MVFNAFLLAESVAVLPVPSSPLVLPIPLAQTCIEFASRLAETGSRNCIHQTYSSGNFLRNVSNLHVPKFDRSSHPESLVPGRTKPKGHAIWPFDSLRVVSQLSNERESARRRAFERHIDIESSAPEKGVICVCDS
jgi:hypothetical protein